MIYAMKLFQVMKIPSMFPVVTCFARIAGKGYSFDKLFDKDFVAYKTLNALVQPACLAAVVFRN